MKNLKTQFAVFVLSTACLLTGAFGQLTPTGDAYTNTAATSTNYGAKTLLDVESTQTSFIQFDLSAIPAGYTSADITKASLKLYVSAVTKAGSFNVDYVNGTWTESTIDASNAPALGTTIAASVPLTTASKNQFILIDITTAVQAWLSGTPNDGIALVANSPLNASFDSKESTSTSHAAELDIVFAGGGSITGVTTASGSGLTGGGTSGTLNLSLTNGCGANQVLQYNGSSWACAAAGTGTITGVTAGTDLAGGGTSGNVTLSLNTAATNALYAQLGTDNIFTGNETVSGLVIGGTTSNSNQGIFGYANATSGRTLAVAGVASSPDGYGMAGANNSPTVSSNGLALGVYGTSEAVSGAGVEGSATATSGTTVGVFGTTPSTSGYGVVGNENAATGTTYGVVGQTLSSDGTGVSGTGGTGIAGDGSNRAGVYGSGTGASAYGGEFVSISAPTLYAENNTTTAGGVVFFAEIPTLLGDNSAAIIGDAGCGSGFMALQLGQDGMSGCSNYTLLGDNSGNTYVNANKGETLFLRIKNDDQVTITTGNVAISGTLSKGGGSFKIDHPLDPANKYLYHSFVESPDMKNIYDGVAELDASGEAVIALPDWFQSLNKDFRYQLTPIGAPGPNLYIAEEVANNQFKIAGGKPGSKVSWQVTGIRQDAFANAHRIPVEVEKAPADRGRYLYPELFGEPKTARIGYVAPPPEGEPIVHQRPTFPRLSKASPAEQKPLQLRIPRRPVPPNVPPMPHIAPLPRPAAQAAKPEVNQK